MTNRTRPIIHLGFALSALCWGCGDGQRLTGPSDGTAAMPKASQARRQNAR